MKKKCTKNTCLLFLLLLMVGCQTAGPTGKEQGETSIYHVPPIQNQPNRNESDRKLTDRIQKNQRDALPLDESFAFQGEILEYIASLSRTSIEKKLRGPGRALAESTTKNSMPTSYFGHWYRVRGTPIGPPQDEPFRGKLNTNRNLQQFTIKNPEAFGSSGSMYFVIVTLQPFDNLDALDRVVEVDGLLWNTWSMKDVGDTLAGKTSQKQLPILFVKQYRFVDQ